MSSPPGRSQSPPASAAVEATAGAAILTALDRSADELRAQSSHVAWGLRQLHATATLLGRRHAADVSVMADPLDAAAPESFAVHARALIHFLWHQRGDRGGRKTGAVASDWFGAGASGMPRSGCTSGRPESCRLVALQLLRLVSGSKHKPPTPESFYRGLYAAQEPPEKTLVWLSATGRPYST